MTGVGEPFVKVYFDPFPPAVGNVVVEVAGCGICRTDLGYHNGEIRPNHALPLALGHEISGRVIAVGAGAEAWLGKAVIVAAVIPCGECELCNTGHGTICRSQQMPGNDIQGAYASHISVPMRGLSLVDEQRLSAVGLGLADVSIVADAVTTPYQAVYQAGVKEGDLAIVIGIGGIGTHAVQVAKAFGAKVVAVARDQVKLDNMLKFGASLAINTREAQGQELKKSIQDFAKANGLKNTGWKIFECSGTGAGQITAYGLLTHDSTLSAIGFTMEKIEVRLSNLMVYHARVLGNWGCLAELYPAALDLVLNGKIALAPFITKHPMDDINQVYIDAHAHKFSGRAILVPGGVSN